LIDTDTPNAMLAAARGAIAGGYTTLKVKLGPADQWQEDKARLSALRAALGSDVAIRLDVNRGWSLADAHLLEELVEFAPQYVEDPLEPGALEQLESSPVPLALDESLQQRFALDHFAPHLARLNVQVVVLKPMALGGMGRCISLAARARLLGLHVVISHLFDGPVAHSAAGALALAIGSKAYAQGLGPHPGLALDPKQAVRHIHDGKLYNADEPGLALDREEAPWLA
jgi:L-alanine-DL-glutamate epimerase-like enolase superfamily enzyme